MYLRFRQAVARLPTDQILYMAAVFTLRGISYEIRVAGLDSSSPKDGMAFDNRKNQEEDSIRDEKMSRMEVLNKFEAELSLRRH